MSVCRVVPGGRGRIEILYKVVGSGTRHLSRQAVGRRLMTLGPLGNGFAIPRGRGTAGQPILVAGGIGIAIFPFLVEALRRRGQRPLLLFGARSRTDLVFLKYFRSRGVSVRLATEDGSAGIKGLVTCLLEPLLDPARKRGRPSLYVCGPTPMLRSVGALATAAGVPCQLALESQMPCGIGVCLGCVVRCPGDAAGPIYRRVCTEGPIFAAGTVEP